MSCPRCGRPVAAARPSCLYCGAALPEAAVAAARAASAAVERGARLGPLTRPDAAAGAETAPEPTPRALVVVHLEPAEAAAVAQALDLTRFEADQRLRRGGWQLVRIAAREAAEAQVGRMRSFGLEALAIPEAEARAARQPLPVRAGRFDPDTGLELSLADGPVRLASQTLLVAVAGPIAREYQFEARRTRWAHTAGLEEGYRVHLHRREAQHPLELDPAAFDFSGVRRFPDSARLELDGWLARLAERGVALDYGFRRLPPVLALVERERAPGALELTRRERREPALAVLDNLAQFRFYSGWRAAVARRLHG